MSKCILSFVLYTPLPFYTRTTFAGQLYRFTDLSSATDTTILLSGLYLTPHTWSACSANVYRHLRSATSQIFTVLSLDEDAKCLPSGDIETLSTHDA